MAYIRCGACVGNGIIDYPRQALELCGACGGTGCDAEKTRERIPLSEQTFPAPCRLGRRPDGTYPNG